MYASNDERKYRETVNILKIYFILFMSFCTAGILL